MQNQPTSQFQSIDSLFRILRDYYQLHPSKLLKFILLEKGVTVAELHNRLIANSYLVNLESIYRYLNPNPNSNRVPSKDFVQAFSQALQLTDEQRNLLIKFWCRWKATRR